MASKDSFPAGCIAWAGRIIGAANGHGGNGRLRAARALPKMQRPFIEGLRLLDKGNADLPDSSLNRNTELSRRGGTTASSSAISASERDHFLPLAIHRDFELMLIAARAGQFQLKGVLGVQREVAVNRHARRAFQTAVLPRANLAVLRAGSDRC